MDKVQKESSQNKKSVVGSQYVSYDAPPLDFSYKDMRHLEQMQSICPRAGKKKQPEHREEPYVCNDSALKQQVITVQETHQESNTQTLKKQEATRLLPQSNFGQLIASMANATAMKNISSKAKEQLQKKKKKAVHVKVVCCSVMLGYNKLRSIEGLHEYLGMVMDNWQQLQWIDISHNYLQSLQYDFAHLPNIKTIYLHCNYLSSFQEIQKLSILNDLKAFTIHGNPLTGVPNFRLYLISILGQLRKLDSVLISKKERENAMFCRSQCKKLPIPSTIREPPAEKKIEDEEDKEL